jgi:small conductance mechanosensitive channel
MIQDIHGTLVKVRDLVIEFVVKYSFQVAAGLFILAVGIWLSGWVARGITRFCEKKHFDPMLTQFGAGIVRVLVITFTLLIALDKLGITITPFVAAASALIFGGSFALQGTLSNFIAGLSIIFGKPFVVGDTISVAEASGVVTEVKLGVTVLTTHDGETIRVPNKHIVGEVIHNSKANKVVEAVIGISYSDDPEKAIGVILGVLKGFNEIAPSPAAHVGIKEFGESSINIQLRYWVPTKDYFQAIYKINLAVFKAIRQAGITIPFPQRDVHMITEHAPQRG